MTNKVYKRLQILFFLFIIPVIILNQFGDKFSFFAQNRFLNELIFYAFPILSLAILCLGIFAYKNKIKGKKKVNDHVPLIIIGLILSLITFGRPLVGFLLISNVNTKSIPALDHTDTKREALSLDREVKERTAAARYYYLHTGDVIEYINDNGMKVFYSPSDSDKVKRKDHVRMISENRKLLENLKSIIFNLFSIAAISCLCFLLLLKYSKEK